MNFLTRIRHLPSISRQTFRCLCSTSSPKTPTENKNVIRTEDGQVYPIFDSHLLDEPMKSRERRDPKTTSILLFPGLGCQTVGMGECLLDYPNVPEMFEAANRVLGYDLLDVCINGSRTAINRTDVAEAAILVTSLGTAEKLRFERPTAIERCVAAAGFSIGELTALVFAGSIDFEDALRLVKIRGEALNKWSEVAPQGMMTIIYGADGRVPFALRSASEWSIRKGIDPELAICSVSYYMFPHCKVIGGHEECLRFLETNMSDFGIKKCTRIQSRGAFHTKLMKPAAKTFADALSKICVKDPVIPVMSNVTALPMKSEAAVRESLSKQMFMPSKLEQVLHELYSRPQALNLPYSFECGPGKTMTFILGRVNGRAMRQCVSVYS